jgi:hypothetical protein
MNFKKVALLILLSTTAFPMVTPARPHQDNPVVYPMKQRPVSKFFVRFLSLGLKGR